MAVVLAVNSYKLLNLIKQAVNNTAPGHELTAALLYPCDLTFP